ncbi:MAG: hypothetical protein R3F17_02670 [Planctomycetota bacterium]
MDQKLKEQDRRLGAHDAALGIDTPSPSCRPACEPPRVVASANGQWFYAPEEDSESRSARFRGRIPVSAYSLGDARAFARLVRGAGDWRFLEAWCPASRKAWLRRVDAKPDTELGPVEW